LTTVLLYEPDQTPFDLRWRMFGIPVRVSPFFWVVAIFLGWPYFQYPILQGSNGMIELSLWVLAVFVSILLHEMGHVLTGRVFGSDGAILLHGFGGLAIGSADVPKRWQRIAVTFAGPGIQLLLYGWLWLLMWQHSPVQLPIGTPSWVKLLILMLMLINLYWPILNLLPIWPLDGGQITREVAVGINRRNGVIVSLWISLIVSGVLALMTLMNYSGQVKIPYVPGSVLMAIFFGLFAYGSFQALQIENSRRRPWDEDWPWQR
jgi:Zn-dependent protease